MVRGVIEGVREMGMCEEVRGVGWRMEMCGGGG